MPRVPTTDRRVARRFPWTAIALAAIVTLAAAARAHEATRTPYWFDEIITLWTARLPLPAMLGSLAGDVHPPLHFALEHLWIRLGGEGVLWVRGLAILFGLATVLVTYALARDLFGRGAGLLASLLLAIHREHVYFSQEARSYGLLWLAYALAAWLAWRWVERGRARDAALYVLAAAAALWTHYQAGFVLAFLGLWGAIALVRSPRRLAAWLGLQALVAALFLPQLPTFLEQWRRLGHEHWLVPPAPTALLDVFRRLAFRNAYLLPVCALLGLVPFARAPMRRGALALALVFLVPIVAAWALSVGGARLFLDRYMMYALPAACALVAAGIVGLGASGWRGPAVAVLVVGLAVRALLIRPPNVETASLAAAERWLAPRVRAGDLVVAADAHAWFFLRQNAPGLGRQVLLLSQDRLPYYEGGPFVPDSALVRPSAADSLLAGARWFGVRAEHGGVDTRPALGRLLRAATGPIEGFGRVIVVSGQP
jgi:mannosyltransferase